jgi:hypothetical protein
MPFLRRCRVRRSKTPSEIAGEMVMAALPPLTAALYRQGSPPADLVPDLVSEAALIAWNNVMRGKFVLPVCPRERGKVLHCYLRRVVRNRYGHILESADAWHRCQRAEMPGDASYTIESAIDAAAALRAQAPTERAFLRAILDTGNVTAAGRAIGLDRGAARGALRRARKALLAA